MIKNDIKVDTSKLIEKAKGDDLKESYEVILKKKDYRIGVGARVDESQENTFFIEVVVPISSGEGELNMDRMKRRVDLLEKFEEYDYRMKCEKDNSVVCEKNVSEEGIEKEYQRLTCFLDKLTEQ
ncbi:MAG: hypothetical protein ACOC1V_02420 [Candidatus Saliniplasma sp.]